MSNLQIQSIIGSRMEHENYRKIKTFVRRSGRMSDAQVDAYNRLKDRFFIDFMENKIDFSRIFPESIKDVFLEIGFGMGDATLEIAKQNPDKGYLAIDVHRPGIGRLLLNMEKESVYNIRIMEYDALEVLRKMVPDQSLSGVHIFFPDPWPKKKHWKRRLINRENSTLITSKLRAEGYLYAVTDWAEYADQILEVFNSVSGLRNSYSGFADPQSWRPQTKFENKGLKKDHVIREIFFTKETEE